MRCGYAGAGVVGTLALLAGCRMEIPLAAPAPADIETTLFLIGDAGEPDPRATGAPLDSMVRQAAQAPERTIVVFLGDNVYPEGVPQEGRAEWADARRRLEAQVNAVPRGARGIFVPGNQDWAGETPFGLYSIRLQERMITELAGGRDIRMLPGNGCPGPVSFDAGRLRLVALDTQWWLQDYIVRDAQSRCPTEVASVTAKLREQIEPRGDNRVVIVAGHHPLMTGGPHGGYCGVSGPFRRFGRRSQDIVSTLNRTMRDSLESAFIDHPPLAYAAGHEHNLQVLRGGRSVDYLLVSGAGSESKVSCAVQLRESEYVSQHRTGFMRLDVMKGSGVLLRVFHFTSRGAGGLAYARWLEPR
ncbi:MAG: metallophosphoesterase [Gemmatimonadota bacterium]